MNTVAVDVGSACVDLVHWDQQRLRVEKLPSDNPASALSKWLELLTPRTGFELRVLIRHPAFISTDRSAFRVAAERQGGTLNSEDSRIVEPSFRVARWYADRHRLGDLVVIEVGASLVHCGMLDSRGALIGSHSTKSDLPAHVGQAQSVLPETVIAKVDAWRLNAPSAALVVCGGEGPMYATQIADALGWTRVLIPDYAGCAGALGMALTPKRFRVAKSFEPQVIEPQKSGALFGELMDRLADEIALAGYDFDDLICQNYVRLAHPGSDAWTFAAVGHAERGMDFPVATTWEQAIGNGSYGEAPRVCGVEVHAVVDTRQWEIPPPGQALTQCTAQQAKHDALPGTSGARKIIRHDLPTIWQIDGPALIQEPYHCILAPAGWRAECNRAGGVWLMRV